MLIYRFAINLAIIKCVQSTHVVVELKYKQYKYIKCARIFCVRIDRAF